MCRVRLGFEAARAHALASVWRVRLVRSQGACAPTRRRAPAQGRFRMIKRTEGVSSTDIVGRMLMCTRDNARFREARPRVARSRPLPSACALTAAA